MLTATALTWWSLNILTRKRYEMLQTNFGDLDAALKAVDALLLRELGLREETITATLQRLHAFDPKLEQTRLHKKNVQLCSIEDDHYPSKLREIADPPVFLSYIGDLSILHHPCIGVVGTRAMSSYGRRITETFVPMFARSGCVTVSGLAMGVDSAVAKDTMDAGGKTVAVVGHGLSSMYPRINQRLAEKIVAHGGLIVSEYPLDLEPDVYTFPARNRIIAGLSLGTLVIEAPQGSGSMITAQLALEYGREVFAVPGSIFDENMAGCHQLIERGHARLVTKPEDVLAELGIVQSTNTVEQQLFLPESGQQASIYTVLSGMPQSVDDIALRTELSVASVATALTLMELAGVVRNIGNGQWVRR